MDATGMSATNTCTVLGEVWAERQRQDEKWGQQDHDAHKWMSILVEEVGEVAKEAFEDDDKNRRAELIQVAAVAVAAVECIDRKKK
jgi:NTP pyrophosphatase (non-canonical NTP hydrolase)